LLPPTINIALSGEGKTSPSVSFNEQTEPGSFEMSEKVKKEGPCG
jgi:hypothetical protein